MRPKARGWTDILCKAVVRSGILFDACPSFTLWHPTSRSVLIGFDALVPVGCGSAFRRISSPTRLEEPRSWRKPLRPTKSKNSSTSSGPTSATLRAEVGKVIVGLSDIVDDTLTALIAGGHVLLEGVPGLGKTLLVRTLADALSLKFQRIQFTPDLMPADLIGTNVMLETPEGVRAFEFQRGPIFANLLLADEINRATPKTQSALLEAMQERSVTVAGTTHRLLPPFFVLATQNPLEMEGTYPLPEAQLDRFFFKLLVKYPTAQRAGDDPGPDDRGRRTGRQPGV